MNTGYNNLRFTDPLLGRYISTDFRHVEKYPFQLGAISKPTPVVAGVNWYSAFDNPVKKGKEWWVDAKDLGFIRGGHCICLPSSTSEPPLWYIFYDQVAEGKCVGEGSSRAMTHLNRKPYDPTWLWNEAKLIDEWPETKPGDNNGTSVRAAMDVLRDKGHREVRRGKILEEKQSEGIETNRWATKVEELFATLQNPVYQQRGAIPFMNSWGRSYPRVTWVPCETWQRLMDESGEFTIISDR